jgi:hypothetical protein
VLLPLSVHQRLHYAMNNEKQDVKKKIMMVVGACIFLVAAAQALPLVSLWYQLLSKRYGDSL